MTDEWMLRAEALNAAVRFCGSAFPMGASDDQALAVADKFHAWLSQNEKLTVDHVSRPMPAGAGLTLVGSMLDEASPVVQHLDLPGHFALLRQFIGPDSTSSTFEACSFNDHVIDRAVLDEDGRISELRCSTCKISGGEWDKGGAFSTWPWDASKA